jgi:hypothetical protein
MAKKKSTKKFAKFVLHNPRTALWQFRAKYHNGDGDVQELVVDVRDGKNINATIKFPAGKRIITIPENKKDLNGSNFADFIRNSPYCRGSEICDGEGIFYEYNPQRDAKVAIEETKERNKAESYALELYGTGEKLKNLAIYCGCFDDDADVQHAAVLEFARLQYRKFNEIADTPEVTLTAVLKEGMNKGVVIKKGFMFTAMVNGNAITLGPSEPKAIQKIASDDDLREAIVSRIAES